MTGDDVLHEMLDCLSADDPCLLGWTQFRQWPKGAAQVFESAGWLTTAPPAQTVECMGCEENCFKSVEVVTGPPGTALRAFVNCTLRPDMGRVPVDRSRLQQWQVSRRQVAKSVAMMLGCGEPARARNEAGTFELGVIQGHRRLDILRLTFGDSATLSAGGHELPLAQVLYVGDGCIQLNRDRVLALVDMPPLARRKAKQSAVTKPAVSTQVTDGDPMPMAKWRQLHASAAANALHDRPGGSREKHKRIRELWATGNYDSRDICAEQECAALEMSFASARKALRGTPDP
jgi:hypothetical protein